MARTALALLLLAACSACVDAFFFPFFPAPFYGGLYGGGYGGGATVVVVNGRRLLEPKCQTALDVMRATPDLSDLAALVPTLTPKLRDALSSSDGADLTFLAPTNGAFGALKKALPDGAYNTLMSNGTMLTALLSYAIIPGKRLDTSQLGVVPLRTALGDAVSPLSARGSVLQGVGSRAAVVQGNLQACHATLHTTDNVLYPLPMPTGGALGDADDKVKNRGAGLMRGRAAP